MATLYVTELQKLGATLVDGQFIAAPQVPATAEQIVAIGNTSTPSAAFSANTRFIMVNTDATCSLAFSTDSSSPTAVTTAHRMGQNETRFYGVTPGGKVAVVSNT